MLTVNTARPELWLGPAAPRTPPGTRARRAGSGDAVGGSRPRTPGHRGAALGRRQRPTLSAANAGRLRRARSSTHRLDRAQRALQASAAAGRCGRRRGGPRRARGAAAHGGGRARSDRAVRRAVGVAGDKAVGLSRDSYRKVRGPRCNV